MGGVGQVSNSILPVQPYTFDRTPLCPLGNQSLDVKNKTSVNIDLLAVVGRFNK